MSRPTKKVIITCAVTGSIHTPTMSPHLPVTPSEIAADAIAAAEAGASVLHLHARDPADGRPSADPALFRAFVPRIKQATDAVINITTGGGLGMSIEQRLAAALDLRPEMCSLNMGTMNFALFPMADRYTTWKHEWEKPFLEASRDSFVKNTFKDIEDIIGMLGHAHGTRFEFECYDVGHLYNLAFIADRGLIQPPFLIQTIFGVLGGIGADPENLATMRQAADRLFGDRYHWSILAGGRRQMQLVTMGAIMGGHVRVGLEDSLYLGKGMLARSNAEQVGRIRRILEDLSLEVATPTDVREMLALKGSDKVAF
ncbi:MAG TPA: 3-keto-5-aminohexanoate cleavage protein [Stellaceae bacterium]|nr:3-keto-5-aminohexanoate cleavage protein [Stellaceae bacterium]